MIHRIMDVHIHIVEAKDEQKLIKMPIRTSITALASKALFSNSILNLKWLDDQKLNLMEKLF